MERFGSFTLFERIGFGGMCEVFRARRDGDERDYALKRLHAQLEENPEVVDLFLTEADIAVMLKHPNLITAYESGEVEGHYFISMELVDGLDLNRAERLAQTQARPVELQLALHIVSEVCNGLDYLHNARSPAGRSFELVHRDVSPDNVFLTRSGKVKVADFGLAKLGALETITAVIGTVKGKLPFMAPEQLRGDHLDRRTDLFATALILYELVTGLRPYTRRDGEGEASHALRIRDALIPKPAKLEPDMPRALDKILRKALHRKPRKRYESCAHFRDALDAVRDPESAARGPEMVAAFVASLEA